MNFLLKLFISFNCLYNLFFSSNILYLKYLLWAFENKLFLGTIIAHVLSPFILSKVAFCHLIDESNSQTENLLPQIKYPGKINFFFLKKFIE